MIATSSSLTSASDSSGPVVSTDISLLPSSHRMSAYRSKYLQDKDQQQQHVESTSAEPSTDSVLAAAAGQKDGSVKCRYNTIQYSTKRMAIANGTCVSFFNQPKAHFGYLRRVTPVCRCLHPFWGWRYLTTSRDGRTDGQTDVQPIAKTCAVRLTHVKNRLQCLKWHCHYTGRHYRSGKYDELPWNCIILWHYCASRMLSSSSSSSLAPLWMHSATRSQQPPERVIPSHIDCFSQ